MAREISKREALIVHGILAFIYVLVTAKVIWLITHPEKVPVVETPPFDVKECVQVTAGYGLNPAICFITTP